MQTDISPAPWSLCSPSSAGWGSVPIKIKERDPIVADMIELLAASR
jgi:hypothetical protein